MATATRRSLAVALALLVTVTLGLVNASNASAAYTKTLSASCSHGVGIIGHSVEHRIRVNATIYAAGDAVVNYVETSTWVEGGGGGGILQGMDYDLYQRKVSTGYLFREWHEHLGFASGPYVRTRAAYPWRGYQKVAYDIKSYINSWPDAFCSGSIYVYS